MIFYNLKKTPVTQESVIINSHSSGNTLVHHGHARNLEVFCTAQ